MITRQKQENSPSVFIKTTANSLTNGCFFSEEDIFLVSANVSRY